MAHEDFVPLTNWKFYVMTTWQRWQFWALGRTADVVFFSIDPWVEKYRAWFPGKPLVHLPVGSNIARVPTPRSEARARLGIADDRPVLGLFGTAHASRLLDHVRSAVEGAAQGGEPFQVLYVGPHAAAVQEALSGFPVLADGPFPSDEVSRRFAAMDVYLAPFLGGVSSRRTSLMTALQHGIATVSTRGEQTDRILLEADNRAFLLAPENDRTAFREACLRTVTDSALRGRMASEGQRLYEEMFDWNRIADRMLRALK